MSAAHWTLEVYKHGCLGYFLNLSQKAWHRGFCRPPYFLSPLLRLGAQTFQLTSPVFSSLLALPPPTPSAKLHWALPIPAAHTSSSACMFFAYAVSTESALSLKLRVKNEITTANLAEGRWAMGWEKGNYSVESMNGSTNKDEG